jgi:hypothetical protein
LGKSFGVGDVNNFFFQISECQYVIVTFQVHFVLKFVEVQIVEAQLTDSGSSSGNTPDKSHFAIGIVLKKG